MFQRSMIAGLACGVFAAAVQAASNPPPQGATQSGAPAAAHTTRHSQPGLDRSGRTRVGKASFYSSKFNGRKMADGSRMNPQDDSAASKTLPLGTTAKVTNLKTGESAVVTIRDRGPHVQGRIVDLSPSTARQVGIDDHDGVSKVAVTPISMPPAGQGARTPDAVPDANAASPAHGPASAPR
ncbi:MAG: septal ring lytic transglycosylase RlpA family protein [Vitreoscilla sp.]